MSTSTSPIKIDVWSDAACPWCYLGKRRLERALESYALLPDAPPVQIEYHSFQLNPELPLDFEGGHSDYLASRLGTSPAQIEVSSRNLAQMGEAVGAEYHVDRVVISNTSKANELMHFAKAHDRQAEMKECLFRAYWTDGRRLGRVEELVELAGQVGLDQDAARRALLTGAYSAAVSNDINLAGRYGIRGVPFFVLEGTYGLSGAQEPDTLLKALVDVLEDRQGPV